RWNTALQTWLGRGIPPGFWARAGRGGRAVLALVPPIRLWANCAVLWARVRRRRGCAPWRIAGPTIERTHAMPPGRVPGCAADGLVHAGEPQTGGYGSRCSVQAGFRLAGR